MFFCRGAELLCQTQQRVQRNKCPPSHSIPVLSSEKPLLHSQLKLPGVLTQEALEPHALLWAEHSLLSAEREEQESRFSQERCRHLIPLPVELPKTLLLHLILETLNSEKALRYALMKLVSIWKIRQFCKIL